MSKPYPDFPLRRIVAWSTGVLAVTAALALCAAGITVAVISARLPDVSTLASDYRPKLPLQIYTSDGVLIGEFGEERRQLVPLDAVPKVLKEAVLAVEDARFYDHGGIDAKGIARALLSNLWHGTRQGASTLTQQVARNVYLSTEQTFTRKFYEALLALQLERHLSKDRILEIYLNQIYLGERAYGFAAASETYFGKPLQDINAAEAAMLAGLPKAPSSVNPVRNPRRARARQLHVIQRMQETGVWTRAEADHARAQPLHLRDAADPTRVHAEYVAEAVRRTVYAEYGDSTYVRGLKVYTTLVATEQIAAYRALRKGIVDYERRQRYRGPEKFVDLPADAAALDDAVDEALADQPDDGDLLAAVVLSATPQQVMAVRANGDTLSIGGDGLKAAQAALSATAAPALRLRRGAVIRVMKTSRNDWEIVQRPEVEGAFVALDPRNGAVRALVGGFSHERSQFNHVTQAWRQPGSSFKPFLYSAALEQGFMPATQVNDAPLFFDATATGGKAWEPKNYDGDFDGPMTLRQALMRSKNLVSVRLLQAVGVPVAQDWIARFGFTRERQPDSLPLALGAGTVTPMQMATAYAVFANGGYRVNPQFVTRITDHRGQVLVDHALPERPDESTRAIPARNAFVMNTLLQSVMKGGTGSKAWQALRRDDLYGKTGTTNDSMDTWFAGFQPTRVGVAWIGYDLPRRLGVRGETGGSLSLPVWTDFMQSTLQRVPVAPLAVPDGVVQIDGEWYFDDRTPGHGVATLGFDDAHDAQAVATLPPAVAPMPPAEERSRILDWFR
ncbi:penicillin-binding protein 1A [Variovorax ginsengisoli]|uniref:Penicillin-binding protein 1A n=1 Tax=Variovorax ginsengisoli TaxID=363844 RepID=A0ABT9S5N9_9BURK|nr:PBP1A family penicillin-binding protein [Variovorax ginsengisoli]MDP9899678.1 penicillin-binding protein 1A [Variovorax ginsengisoli]